MWCSSAACTSSAAQIERHRRRAHAAGKVTALGGPSVSACPEHYPEFDYLHIGELGDATDELIARLDASRCPAAESRSCYHARAAAPLPTFPRRPTTLPARELLPGHVQFSSGCPYQCEFCDIPDLYGRNPRLKTPEQIIRELDGILAAA